VAPCVPTSFPAASSPTTRCPTTPASSAPCPISRAATRWSSRSRGHYCPQEHQQHLELAAFYSKVAVAYTQVATISADDHHELQEFRASVGACWAFLADPGRIVQKDLDIQEYTDPQHDPMIPHTLVLTPGLVIQSVYNGYWFWGRPSVFDPWHDLRAATADIRPDWDVSTPGLREAWTAGDRALFHGWDRQSGDALAPV
jgi:peroxiredoxin